MGTKYLVIREATCPTCVGNKFWINPLWLEANEAWDRAAEAVLEQEGGDSDDERRTAYLKSVDAGAEAIAAYWREQGYYKPRQLPPEEVRCGDCDGSGVVRDEVELAVALKALGKGG